MNPVSNASVKRDELQKKIAFAALALICLMVLFPPKVILKKNPIMDVTETQSVGYQFLFNDPSAEQKQAARLLLGDEVDEYIGSRIEWSKLLFQVVIVAGCAVVASRFFVHQRPRQEDLGLDSL